MKTPNWLTLILPLLACTATAALQTSQVSPAATAQAAETEAEILYERLVAEYQDVKAKLASAMQQRAEASEKGAEPRSLDDLLEARNAATAKMAEAAKTYAGTDGAALFLMWRVMERPGNAVEAEAVSAALAALQKTHIKSTKLKSILPALVSLRSRVSDEEAASFVAALEQHSSVPELKITARYLRLSQELDEAQYGTDAYEKLSKDALAAAKATGEEHALVQVENAIKLASKFSMGMVAPDIEGIDLSGVDFKLSDYEGKVVFLDFWGDW